jgi:predicted metal-dependent hydrolase
MQMNGQLLSWLTSYTIIRHKRARYVRLKPCIKKGLQITIPYRFNLKELPDILQHHKVWIEKQLAKLTEDFEKSQILPKTIALAALNQHWKIDYIKSACKLSIIERPHGELAVVGSYEQIDLVKKLLTNWLKKQARNHLLKALNALSEQTGLAYGQFSLRDQRTRWGSCNKDKSISLNYKLIFLPQALTHHILLHELCHTVHLNHSSKFWHLVAKYDPHWQANRLSIRQANQFIPDWLISQ